MLGLIIKWGGPAALLSIGVAAALAAAWSCGSRRWQLLPQAVLALPSSVLGLWLHDALDGALGLPPTLAAALVIAATSASCAVALHCYSAARRR